MADISKHNWIANKAIVLFGTGSGAQSFVNHYRHQCHIVSVCDTEPTDTVFCGIPLIPESNIHLADCDAVVIASWAFPQIARRLTSQGISSEKLVWYQNHKDELVLYRDVVDESYTKEKLPEDTLFAVYDLNCSRTTYDIVGFLILADIEREQRGLTWLQVVIANASPGDFNNGMAGIINSSEHNWRKWHILSETCLLLSSVSGVVNTSHRAELSYYLNQEHVFPKGHTADRPIAKWEFSLLFDAVRQGANTLKLVAPDNALALVDQFTRSIAPNTADRIVTITLRESTIQPLRNSDVSVWYEVAQQLSDRGYVPVIIPDTEHAWQHQHHQGRDTIVFTEACFNVALRMALYQRACVNLGVNNGPMFLCALANNVPYIIYKLVVEEYPHSSTQSFTERGFEPGQPFPGAAQNQWFIWQDDTLEAVMNSFNQFEARFIKA